jgi:hypothetical protein
LLTIFEKKVKPAPHKSHKDSDKYPYNCLYFNCGPCFETENKKQVHRRTCPKKENLVLADHEVKECNLTISHRLLINYNKINKSPKTQTYFKNVENLWKEIETKKHLSSARSDNEYED